MFKKISALVMLIFIFIGCATGCADATSNSEQYAISSEYIRDEYWKEESIRIILNVKTVGYEDATEETEESDLRLNEEQVKIIAESQRNIKMFLKEKYGVDITEKLQKQRIKIFKSSNNEESFTGGYVNPAELNTINLNEKLLTTESYLFESSYVHETFHQIGIMSKKPHMIDDGFAEALSQECMEYFGKEFIGTEYYYANKCLAEQILIVDKEVVNAYINDIDFDVRNRINERLKNVEQPFIKVEDLGQAINDYDQAWQQNSDDKVYWMYFQAQEIIAAYCKTFNPSEEKIQEIRQRYLVQDLEIMKIEQDGDVFNYGYYPE